MTPTTFKKATALQAILNDGAAGLEQLAISLRNETLSLFKEFWEPKETPTNEELGSIFTAIGKEEFELRMAGYYAAATASNTMNAFLGLEPVPEDMPRLVTWSNGVATVTDRTTEGTTPPA